MKDTQQEQMNIYQKLAAARKAIKATKMKKEGYNKYSEYYYFKPEQIEELVFNVCVENGLDTKFDLKRNELGEVGYLTITDIDNPDQQLVYEMATAIPAIKATNIAQQLGGCATYTERYLKQTAFGIVDNSLDFDAKDNTDKQPAKGTTGTATTAKPAPQPVQKQVLKKGTEQYLNAVKYLAIRVGAKMPDIHEHYIVSPGVEKSLIEDAANYEPTK